MRSLLLRALATLQLVRLPLALAVGSDLWLATLLTRWHPAAADRPASQMQLWIAMALAGLVGGGMLGFAAGMNDLLDHRRDQAMNPGRPLPAGRMRTPHAALVTFGSLLTALMASAAFGDDSLRVALLAAAGIVVWNTGGRHVPALGIPMMGLAHAGVMFIPWPGQPFTLPACLVFTQAVVSGALLHQRTGKRPALTQRSAAALALFAGVCVTGLVALGERRGLFEGPDAWQPIGGLLPAAALLWFGWQVRVAAMQGAPEDSALALHRAVVATPPAMAAAWCLSLGHGVAGAAFLGTAAACWSLAWLAREVHGMLAAPPAWRG